MSTTSLITRAFWEATLQRVVRVFAAALFGLISADVTNVLEADWVAIFTTAAITPILTLLFCIAGDTLTGGAGPAFGTSEVLSPPARPIEGSALKGEAGATDILYALGIALIVLAVALLVTTLLKVFVVGWVVLIVLAVIGFFLIFWRGGSRVF